MSTFEVPSEPDFWEADDPLPFAIGGIMIPPAFGWRVFILCTILMLGFALWQDGSLSKLSSGEDISSHAALLAMLMVSAALYLSYVIIRNIPRMIINTEGIRIKRFVLPDVFVSWSEVGPFNLAVRKGYVGLFHMYDKCYACAFTRQNYEVNAAYGAWVPADIYVTDVTIRLTPFAFGIDEVDSKKLVRKFNQLREAYGSPDTYVGPPPDDVLHAQFLRKVRYRQLFPLARFLARVTFVAVLIMLAIGA